MAEANKLAAGWFDTLRVAGKHPFEAGKRIMPADEVPNGNWLQNSTVRVYYEHYETVLGRAHPCAKNSRILLVSCVTIGTLESPKVQNTPEAQILRTSNLHLSWGVNPNNTQSYSAHMMYSPHFTIFKNTEGYSRPKPIDVASLAIQLAVHPQTIINNGLAEYREPRDAAIVTDIIDSVFRTASAREHSTVLFTDVGLVTGHPPTQMARIINDALNKYSVPVVLFALGDGNLTAANPEYREFYNAMKG